MTATSIFVLAARQLDGRFTINPADGRADRLTGYGAVKLSYGVNPDDPAVAYNGAAWPRLDSLIRESFAVLDRIVSGRMGHSIQFSVWASTEGRTFADVRDVLLAAARAEPGLVVGEPAVLRPSTVGMPGQRKVRWVICNQLGTIAVARDSEITDVVRAMLPLTARSDIEVVGMLDTSFEETMTMTAPAPNTMVHMDLSRVWGELLRRRPTTFSDLVAEIGSPEFWSVADDEALALAILDLKIAVAGTRSSTGVVLG